MKNYVVYIGDDVQKGTTNLDEAKTLYNSLPSGQGKRPSLRRSLVEEKVILEDTRN